MFSFHISGSPDVWASIVAGRRPSFLDNPKPRHVPGTTMTLHASSNLQGQSVQTESMLTPGSANNMRKSPSSPASIGSKNSYRSPGQVSPGQQVYPWYQQGHPSAVEAHTHSGQAEGYHSPGQILHSNHPSLPVLVDAEETNGDEPKFAAEADKDSCSTTETSKVTFSLTDSSSSKSTESCFSERVGKQSETYASVCTKCKAAFDTLGNHGNNDSRSRDTGCEERETNCGNKNAGYDHAKTRSWSDGGERGRGTRGHRYQYGDHDNRGYENRNRNVSWNNDHRGRGRYDRTNRGFDNNRDQFYERGNEHFPRGQSRSRRGHRGQYQDNRNFKTRFESDSKGPSSEPIFERDTARSNVPMRRAISSPDQINDKQYTHFRFNQNENNNNRKTSHRKGFSTNLISDHIDSDQNRVSSDLTSKLSINDSEKQVAKTDKVVSDERSGGLQKGIDNEHKRQSPGDGWTNVDYRHTKNKHETGYQDDNAFRKDSNDRDFRRDMRHSQRSSEHCGTGELGHGSGRGRGKNGVRGSHRGYYN